MKRPAFLLFLGTGLAGSVLPVCPQQGDKEYDLAWKLPHDRAAVYEVYDGATGSRRGDFWLLGCELDGRIGATDTRDLPFRYIFRRPPPRVKVGSQWEVRETAIEGTERWRGAAPLEISGTYRLHHAKNKLIKNLFKVAYRNSTQPNSHIDFVLAEGHIEVFRCNQVEGKGICRAEIKPSAILTLLIAYRLADGAIVAARYNWSGREEAYSVLSNPGTRKASESAELLIKDITIELNKEALNGRIEAAVAKGINALRTFQGKDGRISDNNYPVGTAAGIGASAMSLLALIHSGVPINDPAIQSGFSYINERKTIQSYDLALCLMAIEGKYLPLGTYKEIEDYSEEKARSEIKKRISKEDLLTANNYARAIIDTQSENGMFGYTGGLGNPNLSSSQYAILGLKSASRMGIHIPTNVWRRMLSYIFKYNISGKNIINVSIQGRNGEEKSRSIKPLGWGYSHPVAPDPTGTMTTAALSIIAICESELARAKEWTEEDSRKYDELAWGAAAWIQENYSVRAAPPEGCGWGPSMLYYYLYGLERAAIFWDIQKIGGHDWYLEGAALILSWQKPDGSWTGPHGSTVIDTAWALLFLKRGTLPLEMTRPRIASVDATPRVTEPPKQP